MDARFDACPSEPRGRGGAAAEDAGRSPAGISPAASPTSVLVTSVAAGDSGSISVQELSSGLSDRGLGLLLLLFAAPNALPVAIPGLSAILAMPLLVIAAHLVLGWRSPVLPRFVGERSVPRERFAAIAERLAPALGRVERGLRPRWGWLTHAAAERLVGILVVILAVAIAVPFPLSNSLPGLGICVIALGLVERDGLAVALGCAIGLFALAAMGGLIFGGVQAWQLLSGMLPG